jgi:hypothetical protein
MSGSSQELYEAALCYFSSQITQIVKKFCPFYGTPMFTFVFFIERHWTLFCDRCILSIYPHYLLKAYFNIILYLLLDVIFDILLSAFSNKM